jgi:DNA-binding NarL/FixJ family response regulator
MGASSLLETGRAAIAEAAWEDARAAFEEALAGEDSPEARDGLGQALWWIGDIAAALQQRERAYAAYLERGEERKAATLALWISQEQIAAYGNMAVANGWFARAERLLADAGPCPERVRLLVKQGLRAADFDAAKKIYEEAVVVAREARARDLEIFAQSCLGCLLVTHGRGTEGFAHLDDAMASTVAGELREHDLVALVSCNMLLACERSHDMARAAEWLRVSTAWAKNRRCLPFFAFCRVSYGTVLLAQGRWPEAEDELVDSLRRFEMTHPAFGVRAAAKLAQLRVDQGNLEEAEEFISPWRDHPLATCTAASLELARGESERALSRLERRMAVGGIEPSLQAAIGELAVRIHLERGEHDAARGQSALLRRLASEQSSTVIGAMADAAEGAIALATGATTAPTLLQAALDVYTAHAMPFPAAAVRLTLARALAKTRKDAACAEARAALTAFEDLGASAWASLAAALVEELDACSRTPAPRAPGGRDRGRAVRPDALTKREQEVLKLLPDGLSNSEIATRLEISAKTAEHHVRAILAKLNVKTRAAAAAWAERHEKNNP